VLAQNGELAKAKQMYLRALTLDNKMRVAAKAMLQIDEREQALGRVASSSSEQHSAASRTTEEEIKTVSYENEELNSNSAKESAKNIQTLGAVVVDRPS
jgi:hypothetical protein